MFTGRRYDEESGLYHYRARAYDPVIGRFLQRDPLGYVDSTNLYSYVVNNPGNWIDPYGLATYVTNRRFIVDRGGDKATSWLNPFSHTFIYTEENGKVKKTYTYAWDKKKKSGKWLPDQPNDKKAAQDAIDRKLGLEIGDNTLDPYVEKAFQISNINPKHTVNLKYNGLTLNCKHQSQILLEVSIRYRNEDINNKMRTYP